MSPTFEESLAILMTVDKLEVFGIGNNPFLHPNSSAFTCQMLALDTARVKVIAMPPQIS